VPLVGLGINAIPAQSTSPEISVILVLINGLAIIATLRVLTETLMLKATVSPSVTRHVVIMVLALHRTLALARLDGRALSVNPLSALEVAFMELVAHPIHVLATMDGKDPFVTLQFASKLAVSMNHVHLLTLALA
jgi:hypothetical protein